MYYSLWTNALLWAFVSIMAVREFKWGRSVRRRHGLGLCSIRGVVDVHRIRLP